MYRLVFCGDPINSDVVPVGEHSTCTGGMFNGHLEKWAQVMWVLAQIAFWFGVAGFLHYKKWYWSL
jgi:hypothetical protein